MIRWAFLAAGLAAIAPVGVGGAEPTRPLKILFLGDNGHHRPAERFRQLEPVLAKRGIDLVYTDKVDALSGRVLAGYDGLLLYANIDAIAPEQASALLDFVASGKGFIPLHCASYCFRNSDAVVALIGAQFQRHGTGTFRTVIAEPSHPVMKGFRGFESWDETYVHTKHNAKGRTVLEYREEKEQKEPWTWVRTHGKGRVFYTAWGHDERTWANPGFQNLVERGIRWACGQDPSVAGDFGDVPAMTAVARDVKPFEYVPAKVPFYPPSRQWGAMAEPLTKMQKPLPPEESVKHMVHPVGFELKLFVADDQLGGKPIAMNWDERGRLWVCVTVDYPNEMQRQDQGRDKVLICEDSDGDGRADKFTVFADKLSIPTSLCFANGGLVVTQAPHTLFLKDTDGDDVADERKVLFTGWGTHDTHAGPSNLRYGLDNWIYGMVGYSGFNGTVGGVQHRFGQGFYRFKPDGSQLEFLRSTNNNSWGVGFSEEGYLFGSTANGCASVYMPIANRYYERVRGWAPPGALAPIIPSNQFHPVTDKVRQVDWHGGFTAAAGHALYTARTYPKEYWNRTAFVSDPTGHLTATFVLTPQGTDFTARYGWNLVASDDEWTGPTMAEVGPDGNVWIIDWYAYIVQHNPTPSGFQTGKGGAYETPLRDKKHGRIYRLVPTGARPEALTLKDASAEKLAETLKNPNMFWRLQAQRLLVERKERAALPALLKLLQDPSVDEIGLNAGVIHAIWTAQAVVADSPVEEEPQKLVAALEGLLKHRSAGVRRNAALAIPKYVSADNILLAAGALRDAEPPVRLAVLLRLADCATLPKPAAALAEALFDPANLSDRWLADALTVAAAVHDRYWLEAVAAARKPLPAGAERIVGIVAEHYARSAPSDTVKGLIALLPGADPKLAAVFLDGVARGWPKSKPAQLDEPAERALARLFEKLPTSSRGQLVKLAAVWGSMSLQQHAAEVTAALLATAADEKQPEAKRLDAARQVAEFNAADAGSLEKLLDVVSPRTPPELAAGVVEAVGNSPSAAPTLLRRFKELPPSARAAALRALLARPDATRLLVSAIEKGEVLLADLSLEQRQGLASNSDKQIAAAAKKLLARGGGLPNADRQKVIDEFKPYLARVGNAGAGKELFKKYCAVCHTHSGEGNKVGPDLTGMAAHPKEELIVHILDPNRSVEGNFRVWRVSTADGKTLSGLLASETKTSVEIIDAEAKKHVIQREDIEQLTPSNQSLMPEGFEKQLKPDELVSLLEFLTQRGKFLPLPLDKVATISSAKGMFHSQDSVPERLIFPDWKPKTFEGVPFVLVDPADGKVPNVLLLNSPNGAYPPKMPRSVRLPYSGPAKAVHLLGGVSGWGFPLGEKGSVSLTVRLHYADGSTEDHPLKNGEHFADYIRRVDVPGSKFAFALRGQQVRYLAVYPRRAGALTAIEFVKGPDATAPVVVAVTVETR